MARCYASRLYQPLGDERARIFASDVYILYQNIDFIMPYEMMSRCWSDLLDIEIFDLPIIRTSALGLIGAS